MKIAVLYICTGKYELFWDSFFADCEKNYYPNHEKEYFVFTDSQRILQCDNPRVHPIFQKKAGWPYDTLMRFHWFLMVQDRLKDFDFCYYFNANTRIYREITEDIIPFPTEEKPLIFWCHAMHEEDELGVNATAERNPISTACVPEGIPCRELGGGFFGGIGDAFVSMCITLRDNIQTDMRNNIIAVWHDQSHIIHYATKHPHIEVPFRVISEEEYIKDKESCRVVFLAKSRHGGNDVMRESDWKTRLRHFPKKMYGKILKKTEGSDLNRWMQNIVKAVKGRKKPR